MKRLYPFILPLFYEVFNFVGTLCLCVPVFPFARYFAMGKKKDTLVSVFFFFLLK